MGTAWPPPDADEVYDDADAPNYLLRRATVAVVVLALLGGAGWFLFGPGGDEGSTSSASGRGWDRVVNQQLSTGEITVVDRDGAELSTATTELDGVLDVGLDGTVVLGHLGSPATDGIGLLDIESGEIETFDVSADGLRQLDDSPLLLAFDPAGSIVELVDAERRAVTDLGALAGAEAPLFAPDSVRVDPEHSHVAVTELTQFETILFDPETSTDESLPGALADIAFERVVTSTNRGETVLLDLYGFDGERIGTVETPRPAALMLVDDHRAIIVSPDGVVALVDFDDQSVDEVGNIAADLPAPSGAAADEAFELVSGGAALADHTRLMLRGERFVAFLDAVGALVDLTDTAEAAIVLHPVDSDDRCVLVGPRPGVAAVLLDIDTGATVATLPAGTLTSRSDDGCTLLFSETGAAGTTLLVGRDLDDQLDGRYTVLAPDASAAISAGATAAVRLLESGEITELAGRTGSVVFAHS